MRHSHSSFAIGADLPELAFRKVAGRMTLEGGGGGGGKGGGGSQSQSLSLQQQAIDNQNRQYAEQQAAAEAQRQKVAAQQGRVDTAFAPFNDDWYAGRQQSYLDYYKPEFTRQQKNAHDQLVTSLATRGLLSSSQGQKEESDFQKSADDAWANILKGANDYQLGLRQSIANSKNGLYGMAGNTTDSALDRMAGDQVAMASAAPSFSPVGQLFSNMSTPAAMGVASQGGFNGLSGGGSNVFGTPTGIAGAVDIGGRRSRSERSVG